MEKLEIIRSEWEKYFNKVATKKGFYRLADGSLGIPHYKEVLRQIFHHARENPQIQALATVYFRGSQREVIKNFYRHAISEIGHDRLAANDLEAMGEDVSKLPYEKPLPATLALLGYAFYQIQFLNPIGYLGYLFHLEFMPTRSGEQYMSQLEKVGVPRQAMSFIQEHAHVDLVHNGWMREYIDKLVTTPEELDAVIYSAKVTSELYANMLHEAFSYADSQSAEKRVLEPNELRGSKIIFQPTELSSASV